eukprot:TRINITY_DN19638_c0_g1_i1.p1 TRINITY_DN19638_c0_g1~~TRINITY_DN19638_c0_g1_i1.p1  ORF type:complete len:774 (+),score=134.84 TRINITY_DN19638_c0_g1_i1:87-2408(+)
MADMSPRPSASAGQRRSLAQAVGRALKRRSTVTVLRRGGADRRQQQQQTEAEEREERRQRERQRLYQFLTFSRVLPARRRKRINEQDAASLLIRSRLCQASTALLTADGPDSPHSAASDVHVSGWRKGRRALRREQIWARVAARQLEGESVLLSELLGTRGAQSEDTAPSAAPRSPRRRRPNSGSVVSFPGCAGPAAAAGAAGGLAAAAAAALCLGHRSPPTLSAVGSFPGTVPMRPSVLPPPCRSSLDGSALPLSPIAQQQSPTAVPRRLRMSLVAPELTRMESLQMQGPLQGSPPRPDHAHSGPLGSPRPGSPECDESPLQMAPHLEARRVKPRAAGMLRGARATSPASGSLRKLPRPRKPSFHSPATPVSPQSGSSRQVDERGNGGGVLPAAAEGDTPLEPQQRCFSAFMQSEYAPPRADGQARRLTPVLDDDLHDDMSALKVGSGPLARLHGAPRNSLSTPIGDVHGLAGSMRSVDRVGDSAGGPQADQTPGTPAAVSVSPLDGCPAAPGSPQRPAQSGAGTPSAAGGEGAKAAAKPKRRGPTGGSPTNARLAAAEAEQKARRRRIGGVLTGLVAALGMSASEAQELPPWRAGEPPAPVARDDSSDISEGPEVSARGCPKGERVKQLLALRTTGRLAGLMQVPRSCALTQPRSRMHPRDVTGRVQPALGSAEVVEVRRVNLGMGRLQMPYPYHLSEADAALSVSNLWATAARPCTVHPRIDAPGLARVAAQWLPSASGIYTTPGQHHSGPESDPFSWCSDAPTAVPTDS